jgi:hypothetical protein
MDGESVVRLPKKRFDDPYRFHPARIVEPRVDSENIVTVTPRIVDPER